jgi:hypothetical protein
VPLIKSLFSRKLKSKLQKSPGHPSNCEEPKIAVFKEPLVVWSGVLMKFNVAVGGGGRVPTSSV